MNNKHSFIRWFLLLFGLCCTWVEAQEKVDSLQPSEALKYPFTTQSGGVFLENPIKVTATFDESLGMYVIEQKITGVDVTPPIYMSKEEYTEQLLAERLKQYYVKKSRAYDDAARGQGLGVDLDDKSKLLGIRIQSKAFEKIFGGNEVSLNPQGYAAIDMGVQFQNVENPQILAQNRKHFDIILEQRIQMSLIGKVGENVQLSANYDTQAGFAFENRMSLAFDPSLSDLEGSEDNIIQKIALGNVSMPLRSLLLTGPQSLFGAYVEAKFGKTYVRTAFSEQQSQTKTLTAVDGGVVTEFEINATEYETNANFYLDPYFLNRYDLALANYPVISAEATITQIEVWVKNRNNSSLSNKRSIVSVRDIGDGIPGVPNNGSLYNTVAATAGIRDYYTAVQAMESVLPNGNGLTYVVEENMRLLSSSEYTFNASLGTLYLNQPVEEDDVIAVSFRMQKGGIYTQVGEFSSEVVNADGTNNTSTIITKLIKSRGHDPVNNKPLWDLMMKNVYSLGAFSIAQENFYLDIFYNDQQLGLVNYLSNSTVNTGNPNERILSAENLDRLTAGGNLISTGDAIFDYVQGITIDPSNGKIIFTTVEPFDATLSDYRSPGDGTTTVSNAAIYDEIQNNRTGESSANDKFIIKGQYQASASDDISLGALHVPEGSVKVTANGQELIEGQDYLVDYTMGTVKIINQAIKQSGVPVNVSMEDQGLFGLTKQRFFGLDVEQRFSENFKIGATMLNYRERSVTPKVNYGYEPVNNTMYGLNFYYTSETPFLTRWIDKLPMLETKAPSYVTVQAEAAYLQPGEAKNVNYSYLDDFEDAQSNISIKDPASWIMSSVPQNNPDYPEGGANDLSYNYKRALFSWYYIDPIFFNTSSGISQDGLSNNKSRRVKYNEIYPQQDFVEGSPSYISTFDFTYFPDEIGPYNSNPAFSGVNPTDKWAGISRMINVTNFNEAGVEYIEFWMMDPFADGNNAGDNGELVFHLGSVSEDILKDGRKIYENGLPSSTADTSHETYPVIWGKVPDSQSLVYSFETEGAQRDYQDVGYDGLNNADESTTYSSGFVNPITGNDPAADDYVYYLDGAWSSLAPSPTLNPNSIIDRYKYYRNTQGNSPSNTDQVTTVNPDVEDINRDFTMDTEESYYEYKINISQADLDNNTQGFIVDKHDVNVVLENGAATQTRWYQVRIPVDAYQSTYGTPNWNSIRYMRLITKNFQQPATFRLATLDLVRSNWLRYGNDLSPLNESNGLDIDESNLEVGVIDIESNPDRYVLPPGVEREEFYNTSSVQAQNEQSLQMIIKNLVGNTNPDNQDARAIYKKSGLDLRRYKRLEMFVHAQNLPIAVPPTNDDEVVLFVRMGTDIPNNYYEYEKPLKMSVPGSLDQYEVWKPENKIDFALHELVNAKQDRDRQLMIAGTTTNLNERYAYDASGDPADVNQDVIYVKGRPTLENVRYITIGVRNTVNTDANVEIWVNELRLSEIDSQGGYAAVATIEAQLADFMNISATGNIKEAGFGAINEGPTERSQEDYKQYVVNLNMSADKLLPEQWGLRVPISYSFSEEFIDPLYNPLDTDVKFKESVNQEELEQVARDYTRRSSFNVLNVRKVKTSASPKKHFYDVENLSASFSYDDMYHRDFYIENHTVKETRIGLDYSYNFKPWYYEPFKDMKAAQEEEETAPYWQWAKAFNINLKPARVSFQTNIDRMNDTYLYRDVNQYNAYASGTTSLPFDATYSNNYYFNWRYNIGFDLTKSLKLDFTSSTNNIVDHFINDGRTPVGLWDDLFDIGRPTNYNQQITLNYNIPTKFLPYLSFIDANVSYNGTYDWRSPSNVYYQTSGGNLGNIIQNASTLNFRSSFDAEQLYQEADWYVDYQDRLAKNQEEVEKYAQEYQDKVDKRREQKGKKTKGKKAKTKKIENKLTAKDYLMALATSFKQGEINFGSQQSTLIPGFLEDPGFFGVGSGESPTWGFTMGNQADIRMEMIQNNWVTTSPNLLDPYQHQVSNNLAYTANFVLIPDLQLDIVGQKDYAKVDMQYGFNADDISDGTIDRYMNQVEQFSTTNIALNSFTDPQTMFTQLKENALSQANKQAGTSGTTFPTNYGMTSQSVLMPALLETYAGNDSGNPIKNFPLPNWTVQYSGLRRNKWLNKKFSRIDLTHAYRSTYTVGGITSNLTYYEDPTGLDLNGNYNSPVVYGDITFIETFSPLIGVDLTFRNDLQLRLMYNMDRIQSFSFSNYSMTDQQTNELQVGMGYVFKNLKFNFKYKGKKKSAVNDLNVRADLVMRDTETSILRMVEDDMQVTSGDNQFMLKGSADYNFSKNFNIMIYYNHLMTKYKVSTAYPITDIQAGISARFTFGQ